MAFLRITAKIAVNVKDRRTPAKAGCAIVAAFTRASSSVAHLSVINGDISVIEDEIV